jgi:xanthine dehydrogenase accessory factor
VTFVDVLVFLRGGGDLATGVAYRLHQAGFPLIVLELPWPLVVRRRVALATAVFEDEVQIEGLTGRRVDDLSEAKRQAMTGVIPVIVSPQLPELSSLLAKSNNSISDYTKARASIIDARMAKRNIDTRVIETKRGHRLGRVIWEGSAQADTGLPGTVGGKGADRVLRSPVEGTVQWRVDIGDLVNGGDIIGSVEDEQVLAPFDGVIRGLIAPGTRARVGLKIGDVDSRSDVSACFTISDKALAIGGGVLEALLVKINSPEWKIK